LRVMSIVLGLLDTPSFVCNVCACVCNNWGSDGSKLHIVRKVGVRVDAIV
jgi:hypothetical protein